MDRLSPLISRFSLNARVFYSGVPCGTYDFAANGHGYLHILRCGQMSIRHNDGERIEVTQPSVILYPRARAYQFLVAQDCLANIICSEIDWGTELGNPVMQALPDVMIIPLDSIAELMPALTLLFEEAINPRCGRQAGLDRLAEYFLILLLRHTLETQLVSAGILAGLMDTQLALAISVMHEHPAENWSLERLAHIAGMSRARFAAHFHKTVGSTPMNYLTDWRISVAQTLLKNDKPMKLVAPMVGYSHPVAFARVFTKRTGKTPKDWRRQFGSAS